MTSLWARAGYGRAWTQGAIVWDSFRLTRVWLDLTALEARACEFQRHDPAVSLYQVRFAMAEEERGMDGAIGSRD